MQGNFISFATFVKEKKLSENQIDFYEH